MRRASNGYGKLMKVILNILCYELVLSKDLANIDHPENIYSNIIH